MFCIFWLDFMLKKRYFSLHITENRKFFKQFEPKYTQHCLNNVIIIKSDQNWWKLFLYFKFIFSVHIFNAFGLAVLFYRQSSLNNTTIVLSKLNYCYLVLKIKSSINIRTKSWWKAVKFHEYSKYNQRLYIYKRVSTHTIQRLVLIKGAKWTIFYHITVILQ